MTKSDKFAFFKNKDGKWAIIQWPSFLLGSWLVLQILLLYMNAGTLKANTNQLSTAVLFAWAYLEITKGDSEFRRLLGGVIMFSVIYHYFY